MRYTDSFLHAARGVVSPKMRVAFGLDISSAEGDHGVYHPSVKLGDNGTHQPTDHILYTTNVVEETATLRGYLSHGFCTPK